MAADFRERTMCPPARGRLVRRRADSLIKDTVARFNWDRKYRSISSMQDRLVTHGTREKGSCTEINSWLRSGTGLIPLQWKDKRWTCARSSLSSMARALTKKTACFKI